MADYSSYLIEQILRDGGSDRDLEIFCCRLYTGIYGVDYMPTSQNYDLGRDGRLVHRRRKKGTSYIIATAQSESIVKKAERDLRTLLKHDPNPASVLFCFSAVRTEAIRKQVLMMAKKLHKTCDFEVEGLDQLTERVARNPDEFERVYEVMIDEWRRLTEPVHRTSHIAERVGYRVLLSAQLNSDGTSLRRAILEGIVLEATSEDRDLSPKQLRSMVSEAIGLSRPIEYSYLAETIRKLSDEGLIRISDLTDGNIRRRRAAGDTLSANENSAMSRAVEGFGAIRRAITSRLDTAIPPSDFKKIWTVVKRGLIELFHRYGVDVVSFVQGLTADTIDIPRHVPTPILEGINSIASRIDSLELSISESTKRKLIRLLPSALLDQESGSRAWLAKLCLCYVSACSLGLHPDALKRLEKRLRTWDVIPDTHIVLSVLGKGEDDHKAIHELISWWTKSGGAIIAIEPVLHETLRHARMGQEIISSWADSCGRRRSSRSWPPLPQSNVFTRSASVVYGDGIGPTKANQFIAQFIHPHFSNDTQKILRILEDEFGFSVGKTIESDSRLESLFYSRLADLRLTEEFENDEKRENAVSRCKQDARSLAYICLHRLACRQSERIVVMLTESAAVRKTAEALAEKFGTMAAIVSPQKLLFAFSLLPTAGFNISTLEAVLFGDLFPRHVASNAALARKVAASLANESVEDRYLPQLGDDVHERLANE